MIFERSIDQTKYFQPSVCLEKIIWPNSPWFWLMGSSVNLLMLKRSPGVLLEWIWSLVCSLLTVFIACAPYVLAHSLSVSLFPSSSSPELSVIMPRGKSYPLTSHLPAFHRSLARGLAGIQREREKDGIFFLHAWMVMPQFSSCQHDPGLKGKPIKCRFSGWD